MKIENAYLCEDCQQVTESDGHGYCAVCGSASLLNLAKIVNRGPREEILSLGPAFSAEATEEEVLVCVSAGGSNRRYAA